MEESTTPYVEKKIPVLLKGWGLIPEMNDSRPILAAKPGDLRAYWEEQEKHKKKEMLSSSG
jgi:hypothetical protein